MSVSSGIGYFKRETVFETSSTLTPSVLPLVQRNYDILRPAYLLIACFQLRCRERNHKQC